MQLYYCFDIVPMQLYYYFCCFAMVPMQLYYFFAILPMPIIIKAFYCFDNCTYPIVLLPLPVARA